MNNSYITIIKEKRTALSRKRIPLNQNGCTANFRIGVPFEQNLQLRSPTKDLSISNTSYFFCNFSTSSRERPENLEMSSGENLGS